MHLSPGRLLSKNTTQAIYVCEPWKATLKHSTSNMYSGPWEANVSFCACEPPRAILEHRLALSHAGLV